MKRAVVVISVVAISMLAAGAVLAVEPFNYDNGAVARSNYVDGFRSWMNDLDNLIIQYQGVKTSMEIQNPPPSQEVIDTWNKLMDKRDVALNDLGKEMDRLSQEYGANIPPSGCPWIKEFGNRVSGLASQYPEGMEYVKPAVDDMREIMKNRILYSTEASFKSAWTDELDIFNSIVSNSGL